MDEVARAINQFRALMEEQNSKLDAILEGQKDQATRADIHRLEGRLDNLERDVKTIKAAVTATNRDLAEHKRLSADAAHGSGYARGSRW